LTERGEMVTGATNGNNTHIANPSPNPIQSGPYQLEIRRAPEAGLSLLPAPPPNLDLTAFPSIDTNDRLKPSVTMVAPFGNQIFDGQFFTLSDGIHQATFEFNDTTIAGSGVQPGRTRIDYTPDQRDYQIAQLILAAINSPGAQAAIDIEAQLS